MRARSWVIVSLSLVATTALPAAPEIRVVGTESLRRCTGVDGWCGRLTRPLDPTGRVAGVVSVYYEYYPGRGPGGNRGTLVAAEGGPGYPTTASRADYLALYEPLRADHDVVLMDSRGTGGSGAIDCEPLQSAPSPTPEDIGTCGASLGAHAPLYSTAYAADDLEAILAALDAGAVDLYGDSYGTFFAQVFAVRHPDRMHSLVLDGAYPLDGPDIAWIPAYAPAMRAKFNRLCERNPSCAAIPGTSLDHIGPALARLRARPSLAGGTDADGGTRHFRAEPSALATVMFGGAPKYATLRETDAAARAFAAGDALPLYRLMAEALAAVDSRDPTHSPALFSEGLAAAVSCQDTPQIFDMRLAPAQRLAARDHALDARRRTAPDSYAPFTIDEYRGMPADYTFIEQCVRWPAADPLHAPAYRVAAERGFPDVPVLVVSGELDNMTSVADGAAAAAQYRRAHHVVIANDWHVTALGGSRSGGCATELVRRFIATLDPGDLGCSARAQALRLAPRFARRVREVAPATALPGNLAAERGLRVAAAALCTAGDLLGRLAANASGHGVGLRGGRFTARRDDTGVHAELHGIRWTDDLEVSGNVDFRPGADDGETRLRFRTRDGLAGELHASWPAGGPEARARLEGTVGGRVLVAETAAP